jgi:hypothetical protein
MRINAYYNGYFNPVSIISGIATQNKEIKQRNFLYAYRNRDYWIFWYAEALCVFELT